MLFFKSNKTKLGKFDKQPLVTKLVNYGSVSVESVLTMRRRRPLARFSFQFARDIGESICQRFKMVSLVTTTSFLSLSVSLSRLVSSHLSSHLSRSQNGATCFVPGFPPFWKTWKTWNCHGISNWSWKSWNCQGFLYQSWKKKSSAPATGFLFEKLFAVILNKVQL
jgi:hypothetical protein